MLIFLQNFRATLFYLILKAHLVKIRDAEQKAIDSDKLKTAFLQNISHEIRTPMNSIIGFSELLKENNSTEKEKALYVNMIEKGSGQLLNIVNEVLDISLIETGNITLNKQKVNLNNIIDEVYLLHKPMIKAGIDYFVNKGLSDESSVIYTDATKVRQVLNNLLNNAIKFTDKGHISFGYALVNNQLEFFIEDSGIGIDVDFHDDIFERFRKVGHDTERLYEGVGLGLAICKGNIDLLKGKIWIDSAPGKGSKFYFAIPYEPGEEERKIPKKIIDLDNLEDLTVLVAEDDEINYFYIKEIFRGTGAQILHAVNGREAVEMVEKNDKIDIVLIDIKMPVMNGYEAIKMIRELRPELPIIAQTAFALSNEMLKAFNAGSNDYISKPFKKEQLLSMVVKHLTHGGQ
jgi:CheY-like chemotaxis protein/nitrogen-specific signal transduction histidine kinase